MADQHIPSARRRQQRQADIVKVNQKANQKVNQIQFCLPEPTAAPSSRASSSSRLRRRASHAGPASSEPNAESAYSERPSSSAEASRQREDEPEDEPRPLSEVERAEPEIHHVWDSDDEADVYRFDCAGMSWIDFFNEIKRRRDDRVRRVADDRVRRVAPSRAKRLN